MAENFNRLYEFGPFRLEPAEQLLRKGSETIPLTPKAFELLVALVDKRGRLVEREELMKRLWPDTNVEEANLAQTVSLLRKAMGDSATSPQFIETVAKRGYRLIGEPKVAVETEERALATPAMGAAGPKRLWFGSAALGAVLLCVLVTWGAMSRSAPKGAPGKSVRSIAVIPFQPLAGEHDAHLGTGIAASLITRLARPGGLVVRPLSVTQGYGPATDPLVAGRQQRVDAVLTGTIHRSASVVRVSALLLRVADGSSLWAEELNAPASGILEARDAIASRVAARLGSSLGTHRPETSSPEAQEYYWKGIRLFDRRGAGLAARPGLEQAMAFFEKATQLDPHFTKAHAMMAFAYAWKLLMVDIDCSNCLELARHHAGTAERADPLTPEVHLARYELFWSVHHGFQIEEAIRELRLATRLDPTAGHNDLGILYAHLGLEDLAINAFEKSIELDPLSEMNQNRFVEGYRLLGRPKDAAALHVKLFARPAPLDQLIEEGDLKGARKKLEDQLSVNPTAPMLQGRVALLLAMEGRYAEAEASIEGIRRLARNRNYHHAAYDIARVYALQGNAPQAVEWLKETAATGMPNFVLFSRDRKLDRVRNEPVMKRFMAELQTRWSRLQREFGQPPEP